MQGRSPRLSKDAFTLVELLVVISIIALLITILMPSLQSARQQAKLSKCLSNQRNLAAAMNAYAQSDQRGTLVPIHPNNFAIQDSNTLPYGKDFSGAQEWGGKGGNPELMTSSEYQYVYTQENQFGPGDRLLNRFLYRNIENHKGTLDQRLQRDAQRDMSDFLCPADIGWQDPDIGPAIAAVAENKHLDLTSAHYDLMGNSYRVPQLWSNRPGSIGASRLTQPTTESHSVLMRSVSEIPRVSEVTLTVDGIAYYTEIWNRDELAPSGFGAPDNRLNAEHFWVNGWHGGFQTFASAFADGHAGVIKHDITARSLAPTPDHEAGAPFLLQESKRTGSIAVWLETPTGTARSYVEVMAKGDSWQYHCLPYPGIEIFSD